MSEEGLLKHRLGKNKILEKKSMFCTNISGKGHPPIEVYLFIFIFC